ncbi:hypothetical protein AU255_09025 [Methyloprofundus sedimenti]|uniref:CRISPR-associated endoribonuclease Cas2 n=1 Tax=Methyloprofundus sedimenti TaxID=1420851 RepID=A0A1V8M8S5_9GAMM|nr:CRISPR-associated endonuclease Cas2 [Methyloprofundus sedimenti]OQK17981.1 hypothetical protein AU255_09025 [Methyloprofundus sedimenti]
MSNHFIKYLVCYDICDVSRLRRVHRLIRDWGIPIQFSIFELELSACQLDHLMAELKGIINLDEDKVMFYRLSPQQERICLGCAVQTEDLLFV